MFIPIKSRVVCGFNPTKRRSVLMRSSVVNRAALTKKGAVHAKNGRRKKHVFREMDVYPVVSRIDGNWTEHV